MQHSPAALGAGNITAVGRAEPGTVAICFVAAALESVRARHLDADRLLAQVGLSPSLLQVPQARVSAKHYGELWRLVALTLDDEFFGQDSRRMKSGSFVMLVHAVLGCKNLGAALERSLRFYGLILDDFSGSLARSGEEASIVLREREREGQRGGEREGEGQREGESQREGGGRREGGGQHAAGAPRVFGHEVLLMLLHGVACWLVGRRIPILRARFGYPEPVHSAEYRLMYCTDLSYDQPHTAIVFSADYLALPIVQNERSVKDFLRTAPESILVKYKNGSSLSARIRKRLRQLLPGEVPDFDRLAAEFNLTTATLRRRLHEEGASYQGIKDQLRRDLAISYLSHSDRNVMDIALELGFSERSAFHRAFRKWTGAAPGEFRRGLQL
jgi:AraC-like DNA-binding protein